MDTNKVKYYEAVYELRSINTAAKKLFISPQGLGKIIRGLEIEFHTSFFIRTKQGLIPTENGTVFYEQCIRISKEMDALLNRLERTESLKPTIHIGFANGVLKSIPLSQVFEFAASQPDFQVEWSEYENKSVIQKVTEAEIDYGFVIGKTAERDLNQRLLYQIPLGVYVYKGHPLYEKDYITLNMLRNEDLIFMNEHYRIYHDFIKACEKEGFMPRIRAKTIDGGTLYTWVSQKIGIAVSPIFPMKLYEDTKMIPFRSNYSWDIYGIYLKDQKNLDLLERIDAYWSSYHE